MYVNLVCTSLIRWLTTNVHSHANQHHPYVGALPVVSIVTAHTKVRNYNNNDAEVLVAPPTTDGSMHFASTHHWWLVTLRNICLIFCGFLNPVVPVECLMNQCDLKHVVCLHDLLFPVVQLLKPLYRIFFMPQRFTSMWTSSVKWWC